MPDTEPWEHMFHQLHCSVTVSISQLLQSVTAACVAPQHVKYAIFSIDNTGLRTALQECCLLSALSGNSGSVQENIAECVFVALVCLQLVAVCLLCRLLLMLLCKCWHWCTSKTACILAQYTGRVTVHVY